MMLLQFAPVGFNLTRAVLECWLRLGSEEKAEKMSVKYLLFHTHPWALDVRNENQTLLLFLYSHIATSQPSGQTFA
jgi:hypothetical protein